METLRKSFGERLILVLILASRHVRYQWLQARKVCPLAFQEAEQCGLWEIGALEKGGSIAIAVYALLSDGQKKSYLMPRIIS